MKSPCRPLGAQFRKQRSVISRLARTGAALSFVMGRPSGMHSERRSIRRALSAAGAGVLFLLLQMPLTQAAVIEAIKGGGTVIGTECVNGIVDELNNKVFEGFGAEATLYVTTDTKTRLVRTSGSSWSDRDLVRFWDIAAGCDKSECYSDIEHTISTTTGYGQLAEFGKGGGPEKTPPGQGVYQMQYVDNSGGMAKFTPLGVMYTATLNTGSYPFTWSCVGPDPTPEDQTPDAPTITDLVPGNQLLTATYVAGQEHTYPIAKYQYKLDVVGGSAGTWTDITGAMPTLQQAATLQLTGLVNGTTYAVTVRAIDSQDGEGDPSNTVTDTPRIVCSDEDFPAVGSGAAANFECTHNDVTYEFSDFHILTTTSSVNQCASLPQEADRTALFCKQDGTSLVAAFDWWNQSKAQLSWLKEVQQVGSRRVKGGAPCPSGSTNDSSERCRNQLYEGEFAFAGMAGVGGAGIQNLDASNVSVAWHMFDGASNFNQPLNSATWDLSNNFYTAKMFRNASSFNQDVSWFNNRNVSDATYMFAGATAFNNGCAAGAQTCPMNWSNTGKFDSVNSMFFDAVTFNQDISGWTMGEVTDAQDMFKGATAFNQDISNWNVSALKLANNMFQDARAFNQDISNWNVSAIKNATAMFMNARTFNQPLGAWTLSSAQVLSSMFRGARAFNQDIGNWSTGQVQLMDSMFKDATSFDQDLSDWSVASLKNKSGFDEEASAWCGLGFSNRGRPDTVSPSEAESCALSLVIDAPESAVAGDQFGYVLRYFNESSTDLTNGTLSLTLPTGLSVVDEGNGTATGQTVSWTGLQVPAGTSADVGGGEQRVTVKIDAGVSNGAELTTSATLTDGADISVNDVATVIATSQAMLDMVIYRGNGGDYVLPGETILYKVVPENTGLSPTEGGQLTISWSGGVPFTIESNNGATCTATRCDLALKIDAGGKAWTSFVIRVGADAQPGLLTATASMTATNAEPSTDDTASIDTEVLALPVPELKIDVATQPQGVVDVGSQFTTLVDLTNTGTGTAASTTVTVDIGSATYVGAAVGDAPSYDSNSNAVTWTVDNLKPSEPKVLSVLLKAPQEEGAVILKSEASTTTSAGNVINDTDEQSLSVTGTAVLDLQLALGPKEQLLPGDALDMAFSFQNVGNSSASDAVLDTETPSDTTLLVWPDYATCAGNDCSEGYTGAISLSLGTVHAKENAVTSLSVLVNETAGEQTLSVWGSLTGKSAAGDALVPQAADASVRVAAITEDVLAVSQRADRRTVAPGQVVVYEITYQNLSNEAVTNATLTDVLPKDTRLLNQTGGTVTIDPETQETTWQLTPIELEPLAKGTALLQVEVAGNAETGTSLDNTVSFSTADSTVWANNAEVTVVANAAVLESSISNPESTAPGDSFTYALRYANTGTLVASNTTLQMQVEDGVTVTDCDDCSKTDGGRLSWSLSALAAGADQTKQITVRVDPGVAANSELHAISYIGDSQSAGAVGVSGKLSAQQQRRRGSASATQATSAAERAGPLGVSTIRVGERASPALGGLKIVAPPQVVAGDPVAVTVAFGNTGGAPATGVKLTSTVPTNSTLTRVEGGSCSADPCVAGETITWNVGEVAAESTREVSYVLTANDNADGSVIGHRVVLNSAESREASASANTDVVAEKLSVSIAVQDAAGNDAEGSIVGVGDTLTYTLTLLNNSPTGRSGITVVNSVPPAVAACGQACIGGDGKGAAIDAEAGTLTWSNFALDAGAEVTLNYQVTIPSGLANNTPLINSVSVSTAARFYDSALSTVTVAAQAELALSMTAPSVLQDGAQGDVTLSYQNTGTAATAATLRYVLPNNATMIDSANATVSGSTYTWNLGDVAVTGAGSRTVTIEASGAADSSLLHTASVAGTETSDTAEATTVIGLREELALSLTAPGSVNTDAGFTASLTAQNTGNAAANATELSLTLPAGFTASALDGGTLDSAPGSQVVRWSVNLASGASMTLSPTVTAPSAAGKAVLLAGLTATSGKTQSASAEVQVTMAASAIITAGAQFSVAEAKAGDSVTLIAGPVNVGGAASGTITNTVTLSAGLTATAFDGASWNADTRVLSWTTSSLSSRGSDPKNFTVRVEDAGALTATANSNGAEGTATMIRTFPEEVTITPEVPDSSCKISGQPVVAAAPTPPAGITLSFANTVGFTVVDCDRNPNTSYPETLTVTIDVGQAIAADAKLYKVSDAGAWAVIEDAVITGQTVTYSITDDGELDQDKTPGTLRDPVALAVPEGDASAKPVIPVPLPLWLLAALMVAVGWLGWLGFRRLSAA